MPQPPPMVLLKPGRPGTGRSRGDATLDSAATSNSASSYGGSSLSASSRSTSSHGHSPGDPRVRKIPPPNPEIIDLLYPLPAPPSNWRNGFALKKTMGRRGASHDGGKDGKRKKFSKGGESSDSDSGSETDSTDDGADSRGGSGRKKDRGITFKVKINNNPMNANGPLHVEQLKNSTQRVKDGGLGDRGDGGDGATAMRNGGRSSTMSQAGWVPNFLQEGGGGSGRPGGGAGGLGGDAGGLGWGLGGPGGHGGVAQVARLDAHGRPVLYQYGGGRMNGAEGMNGAAGGMPFNGGGVYGNHLHPHPGHYNPPQNPLGYPPPLNNPSHPTPLGTQAHPSHPAALGTQAHATPSPPPEGDPPNDQPANAGSQKGNDPAPNHRYKGYALVMHFCAVVVFFSMGLLVIYPISQTADTIRHEDWMIMIWVLAPVTIFLAIWMFIGATFLWLDPANTKFWSRWCGPWNRRYWPFCWLVIGCLPLVMAIWLSDYVPRSLHYNYNDPSLSPFTNRIPYYTLVADAVLFQAVAPIFNFFCIRSHRKHLKSTAPEA